MIARKQPSMRTLLLGVLVAGEPRVGETGKQETGTIQT